MGKFEGEISTEKNKIQSEITAKQNQNQKVPKPKPNSVWSHCDVLHKWRTISYSAYVSV